jgi:hypothetical protein
MTSLGGNEIRKHVQRLYGEFSQSRKLPSLNDNNVPKKLCPWIPYAEFWGIAEDFDREELVRQASQEIKEDLVQLIQGLDDALDEWLAGDEPKNVPLSDEYCAFSWMRMAADYALVRLTRNKN